MISKNPVLSFCSKFWLSTLCLFAQISFSQSYHFINYTDQDGLSSNEVHTVFENKDGSMLFGTDRGLQHFDGQTFKPVAFKRQDLVRSAVIFAIYQDSSSTIWVNTYRNGIFYLENDTLHEHPFNAKILEHGKAEKQRYLIFGNENDLYFFYGKQRNPFVYKVENDGSITRIGSSDIRDFFLQKNANLQPSRIKRFSLFKLNNKPIFNKALTTKLNTTRVYYEALDTSIQNQILFNDSLFSIFTLTEDLDKDYPDGLSFCLNEHQGEIWTAYKRNLIHLDSNLNQISVSAFSKNIQSIISFGEDQIICTKEGAFLLYKQQGLWKRDTVLKSLVTTEALIDKTGGLWITTTTKGVFYSPNPYLKKLNFPADQNNVSFVETSDSLLAFFLRPDHLQVQHLTTHKPLFKTLSGVQFLYLDEGYLQASGLSIDFKSSPKLVPVDTHLPNSKDITLIPGTDSLAIATQSYGVQFISKGENWEQQKQQALDTIANNYIVHFFRKRLYVGNASGVYTTDRNSGENRKFLPEKISGHIKDIEHTGNFLLISTLNNGLFVCDKEELIYHSKGKNAQIPVNCGTLATQNDSTFWMGSDKGLFKLILREKDLKSTLFNVDDGLISNNINDVSILNGTVYLATDQGICYIKTHDLKTNSSTIPFDIQLPNLNFEGPLTERIIELKKGKRDVYLVLHEKSVKHSEGLTYSYTLNGKTENTISSPLNSISFGNLKPGLNEVSINIANANEVWNKEPALIKIWAPPHFYEKSSFKMLFVLSSLSLIILSTYLFYRQKDRNRKRKFDFALAQYNTLSLQLSPHFIFNSLNSIQYLSISKSHIAVNQFVANLARLTRNILEHSKQRLIPLATEIENLKLYLEIEKNRFEHKPIEIDFKVDPKLDTTNSLIPPMIIQPSVENAIWHGLLNKKDNRNLSIQVNALNKGFEVKIIDNGIGLHTPQDNDLKIKGQTSIGIKNTQQRVDLYNQMNLGIASYSLIELKENNKPIGTKAHFTFKPSLKSNS